MPDTLTPADQTAASPYRVLARKYRPESFADLIGHGAMVRTLENAFDTGRIAQGWMLTGVRGVGKTTTARILARALNYEIPGEVDRPTVHMDREGTHCRAIMEGRHVDVIEMDAASHTGVDDVRDIIEAARYKPVSARYKVYIIDEVHMLSTQAFNALLKTLEEPPEHVKFVFATTEIRKVPITVLSRCQRFDLRRVPTGELAAHLTKIAAAEQVTADEEAIALVARAAEGSVRDSLTIFDQAIAHGGGHVAAAAVRTMLGLADRVRVVDLFEAAMKGDVAGALAILADQYDTGADPAAVLTDLAAFVHLVTRLKHMPEGAADPSLTEAERTRGRDFADRLSVRVLSRAWQLLLKGIQEVQTAPRPLPAAEMVLVRLAYAADLPTPDEALRMLKDGTFPGLTPPVGGPSPGGDGPRARAANGFSGAALRRAEPEAAAGPRLDSFEAVVALAESNRDIGLKFALERHVRLVRFEDGRIEFSPVDGANPGLAGELGRKLSAWTGRRWIVAVSRDEGRPTLYETREARRREAVDDALADPVVAAIFRLFPGAEIVDVKFGDEPEAPTPAGPVPGGPTFEDTGDWTEGFIDEMPDPGIGDFDD
ncbi:DNA polymerase III subunit gamma/tau [Pleomorphomonas koreensis]|uniref:DNA polymerase III subunit gamma/tau n=1 Tax=Pleomorphomonas koreensis TaxID=257440 RepID=UPI00040A8B0F|nr:DNA polymerase III subunit gamma/tau [Pleomorphomonas koreensis]